MCLVGASASHSNIFAIAETREEENFKIISVFTITKSVFTRRSFYVAILKYSLGCFHYTRKVILNENSQSNFTFRSSLFSSLRFSFAFLAIARHTHGINIFNSNVCKQIVNTK